MLEYIAMAILQDLGENQIALLALLASFLALGWNIVRDLILDKVSLDFSAAFGETGNIKGYVGGVFADAGALMPEHKFDNPQMLISVVNTGRRPIVISNVRGEYKNADTSGGIHFGIMAAELPKMLQPYEIFSSVGPARPAFIEHLRSNNIKKIWIEDSAGGKWNLSAEGWRRLKHTANYIAENKHI